MSVRWVVEWGLKQRSLEGVTAIGVDEPAYALDATYCGLGLDCTAASTIL